MARELRKHLRSSRPRRCGIHNTTKGQWRSQIKGAVSIADRPEEVADRAVPGHWEGDLLRGRHWSQIATLVERTTRFTVMTQLDGRDMHRVTASLSREIGRLPDHLRRSLTWDRGMERADHGSITANTGLAVYFADPRSPWQRGTNETTNGLLRQYFPKGSSMRDLTQDDLNAVADKLHRRPRKTLGFDSPMEQMQQLLR